jgi:hypothetical protein
MYTCKKIPAESLRASFYKSYPLCPWISFGLVPKIEHLVWKQNMFFDKPFEIWLSVLCSQQSLNATFIVFSQKLSTDTLTQSKYSTLYVIVLLEKLFLYIFCYQCLSDVRWQQRTRGNTVDKEKLSK